jgi:hypothetical protein
MMKPAMSVRNQVFTIGHQEIEFAMRCDQLAHTGDRAEP